MTNHDDQIRSLLASYEQSLNTSDAALVQQTRMNGTDLKSPPRRTPPISSIADGT